MTDLILRLTQISQALLTPVIAGVVAYIAWQQYKANALKLALDRYDRRLRIYQRVIEFLSLVLRNLEPSMQEVTKFRVDVSEVDFLFGADVRDYVSEITKRASDLYVANTEVVWNYPTTTRPGYDHQKALNKMHECQIWFANQYDVALKQFRSYLDISG